MTLEEKVGQLFTTRVYGETADTTDPTAVATNRSFLGVDNAAQAIARYHLGDLVYFAYAGNTRSPEQVAGLSNGAQRAALAQPSGVPLLLSVDQEQGAVVRLESPVTQFPGNMALAAGRNVADASTAAAITGQELRAVGINQDLAPVADVNVNDVALRSLAAVLTGAIQPAGRLPVTIPDPARPGTALFPFGAGITTTRSGD
jgi:beta-N-acetylhexosaminidase